MNNSKGHSNSKYLICVITLSFLICNCSAGNFSDFVQNNPTATYVQYTPVIETETPDEIISTTFFPDVDEQVEKTNTPYLITPTYIPLEIRTWYEPHPKFFVSNEKINDYLIENIGFTSHDGNIFCAFTPLNSEQGENGYIYLWVLCQEYYLDQEILTKGGGISVPVSLQIQNKNEHFEIIEHGEPRSGSYYGPDVERLFPKTTWSQIHRTNQEDIYKHNYRISLLEKDIVNQAESYYDAVVP